jgi:hypothetical protein
MLLAAHCMHHGRLEAFAHRHEFIVRALAPRATQDGDAGVLAVEERSEAIKIDSRRRYHRRARQKPLCLGRRPIHCRLQGDVARNDHN